MPHKEDRFIIPIVPAISLIIGYSLNKIKKYKKIVFIIILLILLCSCITNIPSDTDADKCFIESNKFLSQVNKNSVIITDESPIVYYYTKKETRFYPAPWSLQSLRSLIENYYGGRDVYIFFTDYDMPLNDEEHIQIKKDLDSNFEKAFECNKNEGFSVVYKYN